jgi:polar amino acid transport system substrate-binding protein
MRRVVLTFIGFAALFASHCFAHGSGNINDYNLMTEEYPPFNFENNNKFQGIAVDFLGKVLKKMGSEKTVEDIQLLPWANAFNQLQIKENSLLFSTTRTDERENKFKWAGPILETRVSIIAPKAKNIKIKYASDLNNFEIGVVRSDIGETLVKSIGVDDSNITPVSSLEQNIKKLVKGRIDLIAYDVNVVKWYLKSAGYNPADFKEVYVLKEGGLYYAFNKSTPDQLIEEFQAVVDKLKKRKNGISIYDEIKERYLK